MVSTYLSIFYTDVFGLGTGAVALLMLVAKVWDGINDPMMGTLMERTHTKHGRFRPYIFVGAIFLVIFTILTFTVPGFGGPAKLVYAYITYIGLGTSYTVTNVPYLALPVVMTRDPKEDQQTERSTDDGYDDRSDHPQSVCTETGSLVW